MEFGTANDTGSWPRAGSGRPRPPTGYLSQLHSLNVVRATRTTAEYLALAMAAVPELKVFRAVVGLVPVDVMHRFVFAGPSAEYPRHDNTMFRLMGSPLMPCWPIFWQQVYEDVAIPIEEPGVVMAWTSGLSSLFLALKRAVNLPALLPMVLELMPRSLKRLAAMVTRRREPTLPRSLIRPRFASWCSKTCDSALLLTVGTLRGRIGNLEWLPAIEARSLHASQCIALEPLPQPNLTSVKAVGRYTAKANLSSARIAIKLRWK